MQDWLPLLIGLIAVALYAAFYAQAGRERTAVRALRPTAPRAPGGELALRGLRVGDGLALTCMLDLEGKPHEFLLDTGFRGPAILNTWYLRRRPPDDVAPPPYTALTQPDPLGGTTLRKLPSCRKSVQLRSIYNSRAVAVEQYVLHEPAHVLHTMWGMSIQHAPHILTMDCLLQQQPLAVRMWPKIGSLAPDAAMARAEHRWRDGLLEVALRMDAERVWAVLDTGFATALLLLRDEAPTPGDTTVQLRDVHGNSLEQSQRRRKVHMHGATFEVDVATAASSGSKRQAYCGLGLLQYFDWALRDHALHLRRNGRPHAVSQSS
jgi:hypothetical protein